jgi:hypothetical protein
MTTVTKIFYDGQKFENLGTHYKSLESAHGLHKHYQCQLTFEEIEYLPTNIPYLHLMEFRDDEHYNDLYFIWK